MTERILPAAHTGPAHSSTPTLSPSTNFCDLVHAAARSIAEGDAAMDAAIGRLQRGTVSPEQLIALQAVTYRHATEVEMAAKLVDKLTQAVRATLGSQS